MFIDADNYRESSFHGPSQMVETFAVIDTTVDILPVGESSVFAPKFRTFYNGFDRTPCLYQPDMEGEPIQYEHMFPDSVTVDLRRGAAFPSRTDFGGASITYINAGNEICAECAWKFWIEHGVALAPNHVEESREHKGVICDACKEVVVEPHCPECATELLAMVDHAPFFMYAEDDEGTRVCARCMAGLVVKGAAVKVGLGLYEMRSKQVERDHWAGGTHTYELMPWWAHQGMRMEADMASVEYHRGRLIIDTQHDTPAQDAPEPENDDEETVFGVGDDDATRQFRLEIQRRDMEPFIRYFDTFDEAHDEMLERFIMVYDYQMDHPQRGKEAEEYGRWSYHTYGSNITQDIYIIRQRD